MTNPTERPALSPAPAGEDLFFMSLAIEEAKAAAAAGEVPVGAVVACAGRVAGRGRNRREGAKNALAHAELEAIDQACRTLGGWRLWQCTLYVTLEPCTMCTGAILNSRLARVVFGARDPRFGCCGSLTDLTALPFNHRPVLVGGVQAEACAALLSGFFARLRRDRAAKKQKGILPRRFAGAAAPPHGAPAAPARPGGARGPAEGGPCPAGGQDEGTTV